MPSPAKQKIDDVLQGLLPIVKEMGLSSPGAPVWDGSCLRLHLNENPLPLPDAVMKNALAAISGVNRYPDLDGLSLRQAAAEAYGTTQDSVIAANGSSEILSLLHRAFLGKGDAAAMLAPGFTLNRKLAHRQQATLVEVAFDEHFSFPLEKLVEEGQRAKFIIVANPNNPTGTFVSSGEIVRLLEAVSCLVVIDEAYVDFAKETVLPLVAKHQNLLVLRSFSKGYALAGLRVGLGFGHPALMRCFRQLQGDFNLNVLGQKIAISILKHKELFADLIQTICTQRNNLFHILEKHGFTPTPSQANFVFAKVPQGTHATFWKRSLAEHGLLITTFDDVALKYHLRISVGTREQMDQLDASLTQIITRAGKERPCI